MKRRWIILSCFALILAVAMLATRSKFLIPAYAMDDFATPTDLQDDAVWTETILADQPIVQILDKREFGMLVLIPGTTGIYKFTAPNGNAPAGCPVNITLFDISGNTIPLYTSIDYALEGLYGNSNANLSPFETIAILNRDEMVRILVRIDWDLVGAEPADDQDFTILMNEQPLEGNCGDNLSWALEPNTMTLNISGSGLMQTYDADYYPWSIASNSIRHIAIEEGVTSISSFAFAQTKNLEDIQTPDTLTSIANAAFFMTGSPNITLRSNVTDISTRAFSNASGVTVLCEVGSVAKEEADNQKVHSQYIPFLNTLTLPEDTITIESKAFANLGDHVNIEIPAGTANIADDAFDGSVVLLLVQAGSPAAEWAETNHVPFFPVQ